MVKTQKEKKIGAGSYYIPDFSDPVDFNTSCVCYVLPHMFSCLVYVRLSKVRVNWCPARLEIGSHRVGAPRRT